MTIIRCLSSELITGLIEWRNPAGASERVVTELALPGIALLAVVESVAYTALAILSTPFALCDDGEAFTMFYKLLSSSAFTVIWSVANLVFANFVFRTIVSDEARARRVAEQLSGIGFYREEDQRYVHNAYPAGHHGAGGFQSIDPTTFVDVPKPSQEEAARDGAAFLIDSILFGLDGDVTQAAFKEMDATTKIFELVLAKAALVYAFGSEKESEIPEFLSAEMREKIQALRITTLSAQVIQELKKATTTLAAYGVEPTDNDTKAALQQLNCAAYTGLTGSLLITKSWQMALEILKEQTV